MPAPNPFTLGDLKAELQPILWPTGEAENLVGAHAAMFIEALIDLQQWVPCQQINNTQVVPQCNTLFKCGLTVTDAPRGRIRRVYTIDHIDQTTGLESPEAAVDWCTQVDYLQVDYSDLDRYVSQTLANSLDNGFWGWWAGLLGVSFIGNLIAIPSLWYGKYLTYPPPNDAGLSKAPPLPLGYHYAQSSTDNPGGRAQSGLWSLKGGQIFLAPWIQSTEIIIIEWDGLKRTWDDTDIVDNDPLLKQAVEAYVLAEHSRKYDHDYDAYEAAMAVYKEKRSQLMYECREENEIREGNQSSEARGASQIVPTFVNVAQSATASCPDGTTGQPVSYTVPAGTVVSLVSIADANAKAQSLALQLAGKQLNCTVTPPSWKNTVQQYTANCANGSTGQPNTATIAAGTVTSLVSQADADAQALAQVQAQALAGLTCTWSNTQQTFNGNCPSGPPVSNTVSAGQYTSTISQADADAQALQAAQNAALSTCPSGIFWNTATTVTASVSCIFRPVGARLVNGSYTVPAHTVSSTVSQADANQQAYLLGYPKAVQNAQANCIHEGGALN